MGKTAIEWTQFSENPIRARHNKTGKVGHYCEKCAQGCANCYSSRMQVRFGTPEFGGGQLRNEFEIFVDEKTLDRIRKRRKPTVYFLCDMTDLFGGWMTADLLRPVFHVIDDCPQHTFQLLTKRPENIRRMWPGVPIESMRDEEGNYCFFHSPTHSATHYRKNCWLGCSIATQADADRNIPELLKCRDLSPVLFVSAEPLIEAIDLKFWNPANPQSEGEWMASVEGVGVIGHNRPVDWLIVGGESGHKRRPMPSGAAESLQQQCESTGVAFFMKQMETDGKVTGDVEKFPAPLRVRQFPATAQNH